MGDRAVAEAQGAEGGGPEGIPAVEGSVRSGTLRLGERHHEAVSLPRHHELLEPLSQGPGPSEGYREPEGAGGRDVQGRVVPDGGCGGVEASRESGMMYM